MLFGNSKAWAATKRHYADRHKFLKQAFKTAADLFEVIPEDGKVDVVVEYDDAAKAQIDVLRNQFLSLDEQRKAVRKFQ